MTYKGLLMARLNITNVIELGMVSDHTATDWEVYKNKDENGNLSGLLFGSYNNTEWKLSISATLTDPDTGELYDPELGTYARARLHYKDVITKWYDFELCQ